MKWLSLLLLCFASFVTATEYQLGAGDEIEIIVFQEKELNTKAKISQAGKVHLPLVGEVTLEGLTLNQAKSQVEALYLDGYLVNPNVTIVVRQYRPFFIHGEVQNPGSYKYQAELTIEQAIALAGGLKDRASRDKWQIWRGYPQTSFTATPDTVIMPGDVIKIEKSFF